MNRILMICLVAVSCAVYADESRDEIALNPLLVVPCAGADRVHIGDQEGDVARTYTGQDVSVVRTGLKDIFADVLKIKSSRIMYFDKVLQTGGGTVSFFCLNGRVVAILGYSNNRTTGDNVDLKKGADYFIYSYGNNGLSLVQSGANRLALYEQKGIFIIDDGNDDTIDGYAVFSCKDSSTVETR